MNLSKRKEELERELSLINQQIENCNHEYGEIQYDPETVVVPYGFKTEKHGSDVWTKPEGFRKEERERWSQTCKKCGYKRYTYETIPTAFKPVF